MVNAARRSHRSDEPVHDCWPLLLFLTTCSKGLSKFSTVETLPLSNFGQTILNIQRLTKGVRFPSAEVIDSTARPAPCEQKARRASATIAGSVSHYPERIMRQAMSTRCIQ